MANRSHSKLTEVTSANENCKSLVCFIKHEQIIKLRWMFKDRNNISSDMYSNKKYLGAFPILCFL